jgi:hypothetical protein
VDKVENKSINFVKDRIKNGFANVPLQNDAIFKEINFCDYMTYGYSIPDNFKLAFQNNRMSYLIKNATLKKGDKVISGDIQIDIIYDENADFEYFTMERCRCDGSLMFFDELTMKILDKICHIGTYNKEKIISNINLFDYIWTYTVGNFVLCDEYGDFGTEGKPWMKSRFTVMLPIKFDWMKKFEE